MSDQYLGEIRIMSFNFAPRGWALCNGQILPIGQNQALFSLLGTTYGGDGVHTFGLPNLQGRTANHVGTGFALGQAAGEQNHTLTVDESPSHPHVAYASTTAGDSPIAAQNYLGASDQVYGPLGAHLTAIHPSTVGNTGGGQPHNNMQPYLVLNFCIAISGIFPPRN